MKKIAVITVGRSDYGLLRPLLAQIKASKRLKLVTIAGAAHYAPEFGMTARELAADGFVIDAHVAWRGGIRGPVDMCRSIADHINGFSRGLARTRPDIVVLLGDRYETFAAATAAATMLIPVAHIHGGDITESAIDDSYRHAITKLSHVHFPATRVSAARIIQMGEDPKRVYTCGSLGVDSLMQTVPASRSELSRLTGLDLKKAPLLVTYHPVTLEYAALGRQIANLLKALAHEDGPIIFTFPNADGGSREIIKEISAFVRTRKNCAFVKNLGSAAYAGMMLIARAMVGNSSSGIIEAPALKLPVVNIGNRQAGRERAGNVIDCGYESEEIAQAIRKAVSPGFRERISRMKSPYGNGGAAEIIVKKLESVGLGAGAVVKKFYGKYN